MGVVIGRLDVIAAPAGEPDTAVQTPPQGLTSIDVERVIERAAQRAERRRAD